MENAITIITIKDYGKIDVCLKEILDKRGLSRNYLAKASNTQFEVINNGTQTRLKSLIQMFWHGFVMS